MKLLDGKTLSAKIKEELKTEVIKLINNGIVPNLGVILVGDFAPSVIYVRNKETACAEVGIKTQTLRLKDDISEARLLEIIDNWNKDNNIHGILVQMPLPQHINSQKVLDTIRADKDVDGLSASNLGHLISNRSDAIEPLFYPCTPSGIIELLVHNQIMIEGKHCVIIGRGELVGKPLANMLLAKQMTLSLNHKKHPINATVTICHSKTPNIANFTRQADILIVAIGKPKFVKKDMVKPDAVVIDVGVNRIQLNNRVPPTTKIVGDVDFDEVSTVASAITPVPGGVGPMTVAMLLKNSVKAAKQHLKNLKGN